MFSLSGTVNPTLKELSSKILIHYPLAKYNCYDKLKYASILLKIPRIPLSSNPNNIQVNPAPIKKKYSSRRDSPRLVNVFIYLQDEYLLHDTKRTRQEIDTKQSNDF